MAIRKALVRSAAGGQELPAADVLAGVAAFAQVATYSAMLNLGTPLVLTFVKVASDEDKGTTHQEYDLWPDGQRIYNGKNDKLVDYSKIGNLISDGGSPWSSDSNQAADKAFDGNTATWYRPGGGNPYVGRDLGAAKSISSIVLTPVQDSGNAASLNGAQCQYSSDGSNWTSVGSAVSGVSSANYNTPVTVSFTAVSARYWRVAMSTGMFLAEVQLLFYRA